MSDFTPKDELLKRWLEGCCEKSRQRLTIESEDASPMDVYVSFAATAQFVRMYDGDGSLESDLKHLAALLSRELAGAKRARERAEQILDGGADDRFDEGAQHAASEIMEAFDGE